ncbi:hypothetical protein ATHSA_p20015 (plasmid) [Athalassotoga saccharophila]|uniref:Uncharacterized protein n=1 Tax=Athalassotoga saccharophila TaxID=1441386 RepID=A0A6N4TF33_9BACT|nr:hypothetical protein ATHSA_p20015 [Athalassotoga saccharophila]
MEVYTNNLILPIIMFGAILQDPKFNFNLLFSTTMLKIVLFEIFASLTSITIFTHGIYQYLLDKTKQRTISYMITFVFMAVYSLLGIVYFNFPLYDNNALLSVIIASIIPCFLIYQYEWSDYSVYYVLIELFLISIAGGLGGLIGIK